jgi:hypothetical protein
MVSLRNLEKQGPFAGQALHWLVQAGLAEAMEAGYRLK